VNNQGKYNETRRGLEYRRGRLSFAPSHPCILTRRETLDGAAFFARFHQTNYPWFLLSACYESVSFVMRPQSHYKIASVLPSRSESWWKWKGIRIVCGWSRVLWLMSFQFCLFCYFLLLVHQIGHLPRNGCLRDVADACLREDFPYAFSVANT
jgi:hypothetical protein